MTTTASGVPGPAPAIKDHRSVILLNFFEVGESDDERFLRLWGGLRDFLSRQPGFITAQLHQALSPMARYRFVNLAGWESALAFRLATTQPAFRNTQVPFTFHAALYGVVSEESAAAANDDDVIVINPFLTSAGTAGFIGDWRAAAAALRTQPGYVSGRLHESLRPDDQFGYVNVARWRSAAEFRAAIASPAFQALPPALAPNYPALYHELSPSGSQ